MSENDCSNGGEDATDQAKATTDQSWDCVLGRRSDWKYCVGNRGGTRDDRTRQWALSDWHPTSHSLIPDVVLRRDFSRGELGSEFGFGERAKLLTMMLNVDLHGRREVGLLADSHLGDGKSMAKAGCGKGVQGAAVDYSE